ncbi:MAG: hypothetical protein ABFE13_13355 [Phycisphaerales bacterium]
MSDIIQSIQATIDLAKRIKEISGKIKDADFRNMVADLSIELANMKQRVAELLDENGRLRAELQLAKQHSSREEGLAIRNGLYFDAVGDGPFCPYCYDSGKQISRLTKQKDYWVEFGDYVCPACKNYFNA